MVNNQTTHFNYVTCKTNKNYDLLVSKMVQQD